MRKNKRDIAARELAESVRRYVDQRKNHSEDILSRAVEFEQMVGALEAYEEQE